MKDHLKFLPGQQRAFLLEAAQRSKLSTNELALLVGTAPRNYRDWLREKVNISAKAANIICGRFGLVLPEPKYKLLVRWHAIRLNASKAGGLAHKRKYGSPGTLEGRSKGGKMALMVARQKGLIPTAKNFATPSSYSEELAELVGILLGDGCITINQVTISLNAEADKLYIPFVVGLNFRLFKSEPKIYRHKIDKVVTICHHGVNLVKYLQNIGLRVGNKVKYQVSVPEWIESSTSFKIACIRGLMDTDGGVFIHRYKVGGKLYRYKKICFSNRSLPLLHFVAKILTDLEFTPKIIDKIENKKVWLYNSNEVERYLSLVGTHNPRLLKYQVESGPDGKAQVC